MAWLEPAGCTETFSNVNLDLLLSPEQEILPCCFEEIKSCIQVQTFQQNKTFLQWQNGLDFCGFIKFLEATKYWNTRLFYFVLAKIFLYLLNMYFSISLIYYYSKDATKYDAKCYLNLFQLHFFSGLRKLSEKGSYKTVVIPGVNLTKLYLPVLSCVCW